MIDRLTVLIGAGVLSAGMSAGLLAGAGIAVATTEPGAGTAATTSESSERGESETKHRSGPAADHDADTGTGADSEADDAAGEADDTCLLYTSPSPRDRS